MLGHVVAVVGVPTGLASDDGDAAVRVAARHVGRKIEVEEFVVNRTAFVVSEHGEDSERAHYPVERVCS